MVIKLKNPPPDSASYDHVACDLACGKHYGIGIWTATKRAQVYANLRDKLPDFFNQQRKNWLESYQQAHGYVHSVQRG